MNPRNMRRNGSLAERMSERTNQTLTCWLWVGDISSTTGYGRIQQDGQRRSAHRVAYELAKGPIPDHLVVDHLCRVRHCVNPAHLEAVSNHENILRGASYHAQRARATHCIRGHELAGDNLYVKADGRRQCRTCKQAQERARRLAKRAGASA